MAGLTTTAYEVSTDEERQLFLESYAHALGIPVSDLDLSIDFLRECEVVYIFRDAEGDAVSGYTINTEQSYRTLDRIPPDIAAELRAKAEGLQTYELGTIWVAPDRKNGREKLELWYHVFERMIARSHLVMVGSTFSDEIYSFYSRYGATLAYLNEQLEVFGKQSTYYIIYIDDLSKTKVPDMYAQLRNRLLR
ncbi:MAG: hypothetical protein FGM32_09805 [Candidatus Kapabacteria bacterium]|nr:hypothetical protein [Candidatus Kapabacteria bacterium]